MIPQPQLVSLHYGSPSTTRHTATTRCTHTLFFTFFSSYNPPMNLVVDVDEWTDRWIDPNRLAMDTNLSSNIVLLSIILIIILIISNIIIIIVLFDSMQGFLSIFFFFLFLLSLFSCSFMHAHSRRDQRDFGLFLSRHLCFPLSLSRSLSLNHHLFLSLCLSHSDKFSLSLSPQPSSVTVVTRVFCGLSPIV
ncbi:hypothetical protein FRB91_002530 [Serendipita sp. 411]|nr:hypothetical protein FRB91_002530 [Serendipita sp. 411]